MMKESRSRFIEVRGLRYHLREWGRAGAPRLFLLHGWMDASPSFQFVVDALGRDWHVVAPDWRGFGRSEGRGDAYCFPDYLGDLDAILEREEADVPARLIGHSMGGNVALLYAGVRPARVAAVVALDAFGLADRRPDEAPGRYAKWLDELARPMHFRGHAGPAELAARLQRDNPRLSAERAAWLAGALGVAAAEGFRIAGDSAHRRVNPVLYRRAEAEACWRRVTAPVLWLEPEQSTLRTRAGVSDAMHAAARACFARLQVECVADAGHNLHHDQPEAVARIIERFLLSNERS
jgi:pimeloyl-ACP methyl ester carboxylesterase